VLGVLLCEAGQVLIRHCAEGTLVGVGEEAVGEDGCRVLCSVEPAQVPGVGVLSVPVAGTGATGAVA
jgi:hypothetical protein